MLNLFLNNQEIDIVLAAVNQNGYAFKYDGEFLRNNIKITISSLTYLDRKYSNKTNNYLLLSYRIDEILSVTCEPSEHILVYTYMLSNKNVSNNFKHALFNFFIKKFEHAFSSDKFTLYKNILECYLTLSNVENLSHDDSKQLHMFFSVADPSVLKNTQLAKLLKNNHNDIIKNYLIKDTTHNLRCIKNFDIYSHLLPNNVFVIDYTKIIKKINENKINIIKNDNLMRLVLCYFTIEDLLALYNDKLEDKLEGKYLNIDLEFKRPDGYTSTGIEALVDAIKSNKGSLSNTGKYKYDTFSTTYNLLDIEPSLHDKFIEI